jgi:hypothetical protein
VGGGIKSEEDFAELDDKSSLNSYSMSSGPSSVSGLATIAERVRFGCYEMTAGNLYRNSFSDPERSSSDLEFHRNSSI